MTSPGSKYFLDVQSNNAIYRDQSYLATFGAWNRFKMQFRYDEIPHTYSNTTRTLYTETGDTREFSPSRCSPGTLCRALRGVHFAPEHHSDPIGAEHELHRSCHRTPRRDGPVRLRPHSGLGPAGFLFART